MNQSLRWYPSGSELMRVTVKLFANFRTGREPTAIRDYVAGTTVGDVVAELQIPVELIGVMLINSCHVKITQELTDSDTLALFQMMGGG